MREVKTRFHRNVRESGCQVSGVRGQDRGNGARGFPSGGVVDRAKEAVLVGDWLT